MCIFLCTQICYYCDFSKVFIKNQPVDSYLEHLLEEFRSYDIQKNRTLHWRWDANGSVCFPNQKCSWMVWLKTGLVSLRRVDHWGQSRDLDADKIAVLKQSPVNRVSLGCRLLMTKCWRKLGAVIWRRIFMKISTAWNWLVLTISPSTWFMLYLVKLWLRSRTMSLRLSRLIFLIWVFIAWFWKPYGLYEPHETGNCPYPKKEVEMFEYIIAELERAGFEHYEISLLNPAFESRHNSCTGTMPSIMVSVRVLRVMWTGAL